MNSGYIYNIGLPIDAIPRPPKTDDGLPATQPCPICGLIGHRFYDTMKHIDDIIGDTNG
jgi:rubredoxin